MLDAAFAQEAAPLIVAGVERNIALFKDVFVHAERIAGTVSGSFDTIGDRLLPEQCWKVVQDINRKQEAGAIQTLENAVAGYDQDILCPAYSAKIFRSIRQR